LKGVIITGAGQGLGQELAKAFDREGIHLYLVGRDRGKLASTKQRLLKASASICSCNLENAEEVKRIFLENDFSKYECVILINNAATWTGGRSVLSLSSEEMLEAFQLNYMSAFNITKEVLSLHSEKKITKIINFGATASKRGGANMAAFAVPKSSLRILTECIAREMGPRGVHACHIIIDGLLNNPRTKEISQDVQEDEFINQASMVKTVMSVIEQEKSCWTLELDVRPYCEKF